MERLFFWLKSYLGFSRKESRGFVLLVPILMICGFFPAIIQSVKEKRAERSYQAYLGILDSLEKANVQLISSPLPTFNPQDTAKSVRNQKQIDNLNRIPFAEADSITLQIVPGIGQATAGRIIKYRENLGGFHSKSQLMEVFGMKDETQAAIWDFFDFEPKIFRKIQINSCTLDQLSEHPYISYGEAKVLLAYRNQHGRFTSKEDLLKIKIFKPDWVEKISPYLDFD